jgi:death-on-curing protein
MSKIDFLTLDDVLEIHRDQVERYGGSFELRDRNLLESAITVPQSSFENNYLYSDIYEMAAAYLFHITQNHPFVDGNKRTGTVAALVFLELNGIKVDAPENELENLAFNVASGIVGKDIIADFFKLYT